MACVAVTSSCFESVVTSASSVEQEARTEPSVEDMQPCRSPRDVAPEFLALFGDSSAFKRARAQALASAGSCGFAALAMLTALTAAALPIPGSPRVAPPGAKRQEDEGWDSLETARRNFEDVRSASASDLRRSKVDADPPSVNVGAGLYPQSRAPMAEPPAPRRWCGGASPDRPGRGKREREDVSARDSDDDNGDNVAAAAAREPSLAHSSGRRQRPFFHRQENADSCVETTAPAMFAPQHYRQQEQQEESQQKPELQEPAPRPAPTRPRKGGAAWTPQEDAALSEMQGQPRFRNKWVLIAGRLPGRSVYAVKKHWYAVRGTVSAGRSGGGGGDGGGGCCSGDGSSRGNGKRSEVRPRKTGGWEAAAGIESEEESNEEECRSLEETQKW
ncbi:unnamed protein product [Phaeothamnion confervicola]